MFNITTRRSLERASAQATIHRLEMEAAHARLLLDELVRGIETAPMSVRLTPEVNRAFWRTEPGAVLAEAPHMTWRPLKAALAKARDFLGRAA